MRTKPCHPVDSSRLPAVAPAFVAVQGCDALRTAGAEALRRAVGALEAELKNQLRCEARLSPSPVCRRTAGEGCCSLVFALTRTGEYALLEIEEGIAAFLVDKLAGGRSGPFAPGTITHAEAAALSFLGLCVLQAVRSVELVEKSLAVRLTCAARCAAETVAILSLNDEWLAVDLALQMDGAAGSARLLLPARTVRRIARSSPTAVRQVGQPLAASQLRAAIVAGRADLEPDELSRLGPGDAVLLSELERKAGALTGRCRIAFETFHLHGELAGPSFTLASIQDATLPPEQPMSAPCPPPLPIQVEVELARVNVPLSELALLEPGAVLGLRASLEDPVILRVGDRNFARAELVDVGGELGARIIDMLA